MKYIRTKDGIKDGIYEISKSEKGFLMASKPNESFVLYDNIEVISQSDTIEELCDVFICVYNNDNNHDIYYPYAIDVKDMNLTKNNNWYGAIWTDKGLIYVAKMNDKGKLELL